MVAVPLANGIVGRRESAASEAAVLTPLPTDATEPASTGGGSLLCGCGWVVAAERENLAAASGS